MSTKVRAYVWFSRVMIAFCVTAWPATHVLMIVKQPPGWDSWVAHLLLALSWLAVLYTAIGVIVSVDIKREQERE